MKYSINIIWQSVGILCLLFSISFSQNNTLDKAIQLAISGKHLEAETVYSEILINEPDNAQAQLGRAHVLSWQGKYNEAKKFYEMSLRLSPVTGGNFSRADVINRINKIEGQQ